MKTATLTEKVNRWLHEHLAMKTPAKLLGGLALGALVMTAIALPLGTTYADEPARPLSSEQIQCYPEDVILGLCYEVAATSDPAFTTGTSVSGVQFEEWPEVSSDSYTYQRFMAEQGKVGSRDSIGLNEVWTEIEYSDQRSATFRSSTPSSSARTNYIEDLEVEGMLLDVPHARFASQHSYMAAGCYPEVDIQACTADQL